MLARILIYSTHTRRVPTHIFQGKPSVLQHDEQTIAHGRAGAATPTLPELYLGRRYHIEDASRPALALSHGLVGDYRIELQRAEVLPVTLQGTHGVCYFWDTDVALSTPSKPLHPEHALALDDYALRGNSIQIAHATLNGPELIEADGATRLTLAPQFELVFHTDCYEAMAGVIHLVQAQRFIRLDDGTSVVLLDSHAHDAPVLYLENDQDDRPVKTIVTRQSTGGAHSYDHTFRIGQSIPDEHHGRAVESVTVLEQYTSYFMQREVGQPENTAIWTPACAPIAWGWSIRVERRFDGPWCLARRKVMMPVGGHDGLELPVWTTNTLACTP